MNGGKRLGVNVEPPGGETTGSTLATVCDLNVEPPGAEGSASTLATLAEASR